MTISFILLMYLIFFNRICDIGFILISLMKTVCSWNVWFYYVN